jgi:hypothetical protein
MPYHVAVFGAECSVIRDLMTKAEYALIVNRAKAGNGDKLSLG